MDDSYDSVGTENVGLPLPPVTVTFPRHFVAGPEPHGTSKAYKGRTKRGPSAERRLTWMVISQKALAAELARTENWYADWLPGPSDCSNRISPLKIEKSIGQIGIQAYKETSRQ